MERRCSCSAPFVKYFSEGARGGSLFYLKGYTMAKDRNTYAKRQREAEQKRKAAEKRTRRQRKKEQPERPGEVVREDPPATDDAS
jgi:hypothetical protein